MMQFIIFCLAFGLVLALGAGFSNRTGSNARVVRKRLKPSVTTQTPALSREKRRTGRRQDLHYFLISAGIQAAPRTVLLIPVGAALVLGGITQLVTGFFLPALGMGLVIPVGAFIFLLWKRRQIRHRIIQDMPEAIGMVVRALGVGLSVDKALKEIGDAVPGPLGMEIRIIYREMAVGIPFDQAFQGFIRRYPDLPDVRLFSTAFILQRESGGNLNELLSSLGQTIQNRFTFKRQVKTFTAEARMSALIISVLPLVFALVAWGVNPDYISQLTQTAMGRTMVCGAIALEITGFLVMRKMTKVKP